MIKLYSSTIGMIVFADEIKSPIAFVRDMIIDTEKGKIEALVVNKKRKTVVMPLDIRSFSTFVHVSNQDVLIAARDVVRLTDVVEKDIPLISNDVYTENGKFLGEVYDFMYETHSLYINKIFVRRNVFGIFTAEKRLITASDIVEIRKDRVIVKDDEAKEKVEAAKKELVYNV